MINAMDEFQTPLPRKDELFLQKTNSNYSAEISYRDFLLPYFVQGHRELDAMSLEILPSYSEFLTEIDFVWL